MEHARHCTRCGQERCATWSSECRRQVVVPSSRSQHPPPTPCQVEGGRNSLIDRNAPSGRFERPFFHVSHHGGPLNLPRFVGHPRRCFRLNPLLLLPHGFCALRTGGADLSKAGGFEKGAHSAGRRGKQTRHIRSGVKSKLTRIGL
ncbi:hypothetical protein HPB50_015660 [Hyalomma asiaticum]|uniref:Uncharacterized protein n=1 Tax=Hyalomma asiaticum TaxID=266040 RepID=A0ACB7TIX0_HYAAI|nr:hypothetical protein HPB50_015660 [Hyalomma asiaticum]